jgi:hypothetical protein
MGSGGIAPLFLTWAFGGGECKRHGSAALRPKKNIRCPLDKSLGGLQSRSGSCREEKNVFPYGKSNPESSVIQFVASSLCSAIIFIKLRFLQFLLVVG